VHVSKPGSTLFEEYMTSTEVIPSALGGVNFYDVWDEFHCVGGEVHCASHAKREMDISEWWNNVDDWE
jgi:hypothetical protein